MKFVKILIIVLVVGIGIGMTRFGPTFELFPRYPWCSGDLSNGTNFTINSSNDYAQLTKALEEKGFDFVSDWNPITGEASLVGSNLEGVLQFEKKSKKLWGRESFVNLKIYNYAKVGSGGGHISINNSFKLEANSIVRNVKRVFEEEGWTGVSFEPSWYHRPCD